MIMAVWVGLFLLLAIGMAFTTDASAGTQPFAAAFFVIWRVNALVAGFTWAAMAGLPVWLLGRPDVRRWFRERAG
jgi:hypothetical protein